MAPKRKRSKKSSKTGKGGNAKKRKIASEPTAPEPTAPAVTPGTTPGFFKLPPELRADVYALLRSNYHHMYVPVRNPKLEGREREVHWLSEESVRSLKDLKMFARTNRQINNEVEDDFPGPHDIMVIDMMADSLLAFVVGQNLAYYPEIYKAVTTRAISRTNVPDATLARFRRLRIVWPCVMRLPEPSTSNVLMTAHIELSIIGRTEWTIEHLIWKVVKQEGEDTDISGPQADAEAWLRRTIPLNLGGSLLSKEELEELVLDLRCRPLVGFRTPSGWGRLSWDDVVRRVRLEIDPGHGDELGNYQKFWRFEDDEWHRQPAPTALGEAEGSGTAEGN